MCSFREYALNNWNLAFSGPLLKDQLGPRKSSKSYYLYSYTVQFPIDYKNALRFIVINIRYLYVELQSVLEWKKFYLKFRATSKLMAD